MLREVLSECTRQGFSIVRVATQRLEAMTADGLAVAVTLEVQGQPHPESLAASLSDLVGVHEISASDFTDTGD